MWSVAQSILWELYSRGRWQILTFFLVGNALPMMFYAALCHHGVDLREKEFIVLHIMFLPIVMTNFAVGIFPAQGALSRLYTLPIATGSIVAWHMFPGAILMSLQVAVSLWAQGRLFYYGLPVLGPSLFAAAAWAAAQLTVSIQHRTFRGVVLMFVPIVACFIWLLSRYGTWSSYGSHYWSHVTVGDVFAMLFAVVISYVLTVAAVSRDRCGEGMKPLRLWATVGRWVDEWSTGRGVNQSSFRSAVDAQAWYEWKQKGIALPVGIATLLAISTIVFLVRLVATGNASQTVAELYEGLIVGGWLLTFAAATIGFMVGNTSSGIQVRHQSSTVRELMTVSELDCIGHFQATMPIATSTFARCILWNAGKSVMLAWAIWASSLLLTHLMAGAASPLPEKMQRLVAEPWYLPATLLGAWIGMTVAATITMTGRSSRLILAVAALFVVTVCVQIAVQNLASTQVQKLLFNVSVFVVSGLFFLAASVAMFIARRRNMLDRATAISMMAAGIMIVLLAYATRPLGLPVVAHAVIVAVSSLSVLPVAAAPLALAWNRHR